MTNALLGTSAGFSSKLQIAPDALPDNSLTQRYRLLYSAQNLMFENKSFRECQHAPIPEATYVTANYNPDSGTASYGNLQVCGFGMCPYCAWKRAYRDRVELAVAFAQIKKAGNFATMITFTLSHGLNDDLIPLLDDLQTAYNKTFSGRWFTDLAAEWNIVGRVKALEQPYGENGWHPHLHVLFESEIEITGKWCEVLRGEITKRYISKLKTIGRTATVEHAVDVTTADSKVAEYIAKFGREPISKTWGVAEEMALSNAKKSSTKGITPFQMLSAYAGNDEIIERLMDIWKCYDRDRVKKRAGAKYREYFQAMLGRHRLRWSKGMRERLGLEQAIKDYYAAQIDEASYGAPVVMINRGQHGWYKIIELGLRTDFIKVVATGNAFYMANWLREHEIESVMTDVAYEMTYASVDF